MNTFIKIYYDNEDYQMYYYYYYFNSVIIELCLIPQHKLNLLLSVLIL